MRNFHNLENSEAPAYHSKSHWTEYRRADAFYVCPLNRGDLVSDKAYNQSLSSFRDIVIKCITHCLADGKSTFNHHFFAPRT